MVQTKDRIYIDTRQYIIVPRRRFHGLLPKVGIGELFLLAGAEGLS